jgi:hypothetical protein
MKIKQLGNGGAFDYDKTNSSFLIDIGTEEKRSLILFDCGYNVYSKLREIEKEDENIIKDIDLIWISHLDDDHVGSLKTLIYYRYYILGKETPIIRNSLESELKNFLSDMNQTMKFGKFIETNILYIVDRPIIHIKNTTYVISETKTFHHLDCYGLCVKEINNETNEYTSILYISGDTKVCSGTIEALNDIVQSIGTLKNYKIYHDYSNWNSYENNVHTCEYDFNKYYLQNDTFKDLEITKYHNNAEFDENWVEI